MQTFPYEFMIERRNICQLWVHANQGPDVLIRVWQRLTMYDHITPCCDDLAAHQLSGRLGDDDCGILAKHLCGRGSSQSGIAAGTGDEVSLSLSLSCSMPVIASCLPGVCGAPDEIPNAPGWGVSVREKVLRWAEGRE